MIGNHPSNKGGMTSVINQIREHDWEKEEIKLSFIPTFIPGNSMKKILFFLVALTKILWIFIFSKPDIVYMHMSYKGSFTRKYIVHKLCLLFSIKDVIHLHGIKLFSMYKDSSLKKRMQVKRMISECNAFIVLGERDAIKVRKITPDSKVYVVHNCIKIPSSKVRWDGKLHLLYMGVLNPAKGVADLMQCLYYLQTDELDIKIDLEICGTGSEEESLIRYAHEHSLEKIVRFNGWITGDRKKEKIKEANVFLLPSYTEGLPMSVLEAMSYGMPIISTRVGDLPELVKEDVNGYLIKPGDINAMREKILLMGDQKRWERFSHNSREIIKENFNIDLLYSRLLNIIKDVAAR